MHYRTLWIQCRALYIKFRALLRMHLRALLIDVEGYFIEYKALLINVEGCFVEYKALLINVEGLYSLHINQNSSAFSKEPYRAFYNQKSLIEALYSTFGRI